MTIEKELLKEHTKEQATRIQRYIGNDPDRFNELVQLLLNGTYRVTQRAAWPLSLCIEKNPLLANPHLNVLIKNLAKPELHDAVKRNTLRLLQYIDIPKKLHGLTIETCFRLLQDPKEPVAVRVFAMTVAANIAKEFPELKKELLLIMEDQIPYGTAGYVARAKKIIKQLKNNK